MQSLFPNIEYEMVGRMERKQENTMCLNCNDLEYVYSDILFKTIWSHNKYELLETKSPSNGWLINFGDAEMSADIPD